MRITEGIHESQNKFYSCEKKIRFRNRKRAVNTLRNIKKKEIITKPNLQIYKCKFCDGWHIGHARGENHEENNVNVGNAVVA